MMTVSIGTVGEVRWDEVGNRFKGIIPTMHASLSELFTTLRKVVDEAAPTSATEDVRLTFRTFIGPNVNIDIVHSIRLPWDGTELVCEAAISLGKHGHLVYFGACTAKRASGTETRLAEWSLYDEMNRRGQRPLRPLPDGYSIARVHATRVSDAEVAEMVGLYQLCYSSYMVDFNAESVRAMICDNLFVAVKDSTGRIVCVGQAEHVNIDTVSGGIWTLVEISENATHPDFQGLGLSQHARVFMIEAIRAPRTVIYVECRANHAGVIGANLNVGMRLAGRLDHHTYMNSAFSEVKQEGRYNTLFVMHLPVDDR